MFIRHARRQLRDAEKKFLETFAIVSIVVGIVSFLIGLGLGKLVIRLFSL